MAPAGADEGGRVVLLLDMMRQKDTGVFLIAFQIQWNF
jgi:hypothetical protein